MWVHLAELFFVLSGFATFALAVIHQRKAVAAVASNKAVLAAIDEESKRTIAEISALRKQLDDDAQFYIDDFAQKMKACRNFIKLWNAGFKSEAVKALEDVGFHEATLQ